MANEKKLSLEAVIDAMVEPVVVCDLDGNVVFINLAHEKTFGYKQREVVGKHFLELPGIKYLKPEDVEKFVPLIKETIKKGSAGPLKFVLPTKDGRMISMSIAGGVIKDAQGNPTHIVCVIRDITELNKTEEEIIRLSNAVKMSTDSIVISDMEGKIIDVNKATLKMHGTDDKRDLIGKSAFDFIAPEDREEASVGMKEVMEKGHTKGREYRVIIKDGSKIPVETDTAIMKDADGKPIGFVGITRDITERKRAEEEKSKILHDLKERVKELNCLHKIAKIVAIPNILLEEIFRKTVAIIPPTWQYPDITCARVIVGGQEFKPINFKETKWKQSADITVGGKKAGVIEVYYLEEKPEIDEGPFLKEERNLIEAIAERLGSITERKQAEKALKHLNAVLRVIRNVNQLIARETDRNRLIKGACDNLIETRGYFNAWICLLDESGNFIASAEAGLGKNFKPMLERLKSGELTACGRRALAQSDVVVTDDPPSACVDCPLAKTYCGRGAMSVRLEHGGNVYGLLAISIPTAYITDEAEWSLLKEVAGDIARALHIMETEEERKRAEEALQKSEEKLQLLIKNAHDVIFRLELDKGYTFMSPSVEKLLGYRPEDYYNDPAYYRKITLPDDFPKVENLLSYLRRGKDPPKMWELRQFHKDGHLIHLEFTFTAVRDETGKIVALEGVARDITERKLAEEELKVKIKELEEFHDLVVGRELKMKQMEEELKRLRAKYGERR